MFEIAHAENTMTSREIAVLVEKRHDNVMVVCRELRATKVCPEIKETPYFNEQNGQTYLQCILTKRDSYVLVARLSPEFTARLVDRWQELEARAAKPVELSRMDLIQLAMQAETERLALTAQVQTQQAVIEAQAPKVEALDRISAADGSICITNAAKDLQMRPKDLFSKLRMNHFIYRRAGGSSWCAYQDKIQSGILTHKVTTVEHSDGTRRMVEPALPVLWASPKPAQQFGAAA